MIASLEGVVVDTRTMPNLMKVRLHWSRLPQEEREAIFPNLYSHWIGWGEPFCFRCRWLAPCEDDGNWLHARGWLERAHLQDRCVGGPNTPENLVPLCPLCHHDMPPFDTREEAIKWINEGKKRHWLWQMCTDSMTEEMLAEARLQSNRGKYQRIRALYGHFLEEVAK